jgi:tripartite-type tricarboxylate transporter receptor subunit TctC
MKEWRGTRALVAGAAGLFIACASAHAQSPAEFYKGRTIDIIVGSLAGGGYDQYARVLARHMPTHLPGNP